MSLKVYNDCKGRPSYFIPKKQLEFYISSGFTVEKIRKMIGVSISTSKRQMKYYSIKISDNYCNLSDDDFDMVIKDEMKEFPNCGCRRMSRLLLGKEFIFKRPSTKSNAMSRSEGVLLKTIQLKVTHRRRYDVRGPLSLWNIDGHHKLIR